MLHGSQKPRSLIVAGLHRPMKAKATRGWPVAGLVRQFVRADRIVVVMLHVAGEAQCCGGSRLTALLRVTAQQGANDQVAIDGAGDGLAETHIAQNRIAEIEVVLLNLGAWGVLDLDVGPAGQDGEDRASQKRDGPA